MIITRPHLLRVSGLLAAIALVATACGGGTAPATDTTPGTTARTETLDGPRTPDTAFEMFDGATATLATFEGQPTVLNFWASWCPSCVAEMSAAFRPVHEELGDTITFLGMNIQDERDLAVELLEATGVKWLNAEDAGGALYAQLGGLGMPFTVVIAADGRILDTHNGPLDETQLRSLISETIG